MIPIESFECQSMTGNFVPIVPGGSNIKLTYQNRKEYVEKAMNFRLHKLDHQVHTRELCYEFGVWGRDYITREGKHVAMVIAAKEYICVGSLWQVVVVREGMFFIIPLPLLSLYTAKMVETAMCGYTRRLTYTC